MRISGANWPEPSPPCEYVFLFDPIIGQFIEVAPRQPDGLFGPPNTAFIVPDNTTTGNHTVRVELRITTTQQLFATATAPFTTRNDLSIDHTNPIIPGNSRVQARRVLTRSDLTLRLRSCTNQPVRGVGIALQSDRGALDVITGPQQATDANGVTTAQVETRRQPGRSTITATNPDIRTVQPAVIDWLPADYERDFVVTCYVLSDENDFVGTRLINGVCGLPPQNQYHSGFLRDVRLQGSGRALNGDIIHYAGRNCFQILPCPQTASGACAQDGVTIAVDPGVIPLGSTVNVRILGDRVAQDTGGAINGYRIDNYMGTNRAACIAFGRQNSAVRFLSY